MFGVAAGMPDAGASVTDVASLLSESATVDAPKLPGIASLALPSPLAPAAQAPAAGPAVPALAAMGMLGSTARSEAPATGQGAGMGPATVLGGALPWPPMRSPAGLVGHAGQVAVASQPPFQPSQQAAAGTGAVDPMQSSAVLASMLAQLRQQQMQVQMQMQQQQIHLHQQRAVLVQQQPPPVDLGGVQQQLLHSELAGQEPAMLGSQAHRPGAPRQPSERARQSWDTASSSRSSADSLSRSGGAGSPNNPPNSSLSTLMACNDKLKKQLKENELQIRRAREGHGSPPRDGASNDGNSNDGGQGSDDDSTNGSSNSTNGSSSVSNASTTPGVKDEAQSGGQSRYWSEDEHRRFLEAVRCFGAHNHKAIASHVGSRNATQVRSHSQKFFKKLESHRGRGLPTMLRKRKGVKDESGL